MIEQNRVNNAGLKLEHRTLHIARGLNLVSPYFRPIRPSALNSLKDIVGETAFDVERVLGLDAHPPTYRVGWELFRPVVLEHGLVFADAVYSRVDHDIAIHPDKLYDAGKLLEKRAIVSLLSEYTILDLKFLIAHESYHAKVNQDGEQVIYERQMAHYASIKDRQLDPYYDDVEQHDADAFAYKYIKKSKSSGFSSFVARHWVEHNSRKKLREYHRRGVHR